MNQLKILFCLLVFGLTSLNSFGVTALSDSQREHKILFICTGNFYRSRFAEALFNYYKSEKKLTWKAFSRGIDINSLTPAQIGSGISELVIKGLETLSIPLSFAEGKPTQLTQNDLEQN